MKKLQKVLTCFLVMCLLLGCVSTGASAEEPKNLSITRNGVTYYFPHFRAAFAAAAAGDTIVVLQDFEEPKDPSLGEDDSSRPNPDPFEAIGGINPYLYVPEGAPITIELGAHAVTGYGGYQGVGFVGGSVLLRGGTQGGKIGEFGMVGAASGCNLTLEGCKTEGISARNGKITVRDSQVGYMILMDGSIKVENSEVANLAVPLEDGLSMGKVSVESGRFTGLFAGIDPDEIPDDVPNFGIYFSTEQFDPAETPDQYPTQEAIDQENQRRLEGVKAYAAEFLETLNGTNGKKTLVHDGRPAEIKTTMMESGRDLCYIAYFDAPLTVSSKITLNANGGGGSPESVYTDDKGKLDLAGIAEPTWEEYTFDGWYTAGTGGEKVTAGTAFDRDDTVYAHWKDKDGNPLQPEKPAKPIVPAPIEPEQPFLDVPAGAWYAQAVQDAVDYGLFCGTGEKTFSPDDEMTRAMFLTTLHNDSGKPEVEYAIDFTDVTGGSWYQWAVRWGVAKKVAAGVSRTEFAPERPITREQLATMLYQYAKQLGVDVQARSELSDFPDAARVSRFARPAMEWAVAKGYITGRADGGVTRLAPQGTATRAEAACVLVKFVEAQGK